MNKKSKNILMLRKVIIIPEKTAMKIIIVNLIIRRNLTKAKFKVEK
jgi:hypothetical protein